MPSGNQISQISGELLLQLSSCCLPVLTLFVGARHHALSSVSKLPDQYFCRWQPAACVYSCVWFSFFSISLAKRSIVWDERLQNDLYCDECDVNLNQSIITVQSGYNVVILFIHDSIQFPSSMTALCMTWIHSCCEALITESACRSVNWSPQKMLKFTVKWHKLWRSI